MNFLSPIDYTLIRSPRRRKTISLQLSPDGTIRVQAPLHTPRREIDTFLNQKQDWLEKKLREQQQRREAAPPKKIASGETFFFLGEVYPLEIAHRTPQEEPLVFNGEQFLLHEADVERGRVIFAAWYQRQALAHLQKRLAVFSLMMGVLPRGLKITQAKRRWGSCSAENRLSFTWRLIMTPPDVVDYVVVHELAHIREKNHSSAFWGLVAGTAPRFQEHRRWLRKHDHLLHL